MVLGARLQGALLSCALLSSLLCASCEPDEASAPVVAVVTVGPMQAEQGTLEIPFAIYHQEGAAIEVALRFCPSGVSCHDKACQRLEGIGREGRVTLRGSESDALRSSGVRWTPSCEAFSSPGDWHFICIAPDGGDPMKSAPFIPTRLGLDQACEEEAPAED